MERGLPRGELLMVNDLGLKISSHHLDYFSDTSFQMIWTFSSIFPFSTFSVEIICLVVYGHFFFLFFASKRELKLLWRVPHTQTHALYQKDTTS
jgi:hypothetical protein